MSEMTKTAKFFGDVKTIYLTIALLITACWQAVTWAGDSRWMQIENAQQAFKELDISTVQSEMERTNNEIAELQIKLKYATSQREKDMLGSLIIFKDAKLKTLKTKLQTKRGQ